MKSNLLNLSVAITIFFVTGCKKNITGENQEIPREVNPSLVYKMPSTEVEKQLVVNLGKITSILKELYKDKTNLKIVNAAIFSKAYTDGSILVKDLIYADISILQTNEKFQSLTGKLGIRLDYFAGNFWAKVDKGNDTSFKAFLETLNYTSRRPDGAHRTTLESTSQVSIYIPYVERIEDGVSGLGAYDPITSIVTATADADEGYGSQPYYVNGQLQSYFQILVNEDYVYNHPTQIVGVNGAELSETIVNTNTAIPSGDPIDLPNLPREVKQVYIGDVRCKNQYDALISFTGNGGGSEIRFTRADGYLKVADGQVQADMYVIGDKTISRYAIRKEHWVDYLNEWDGDWEAENLEQNLAIYEEDNRNSSTFSASLTTTLTLRPAGSQPGLTLAAPIGFNINFKSDDAIIKQTNYNRDIFFILNRTNLEGEMNNGWPVRDKNDNVSFTLKDRTYF